MILKVDIGEEGADQLATRDPLVVHLGGLLAAKPIESCGPLKAGTCWIARMHGPKDSHGRAQAANLMHPHDISYNSTSDGSGHMKICTSLSSESSDTGRPPQSVTNSRLTKTRRCRRMTQLKLRV